MSGKTFLSFLVMAVLSSLVPWRVSQAALIEVRTLDGSANHAGNPTQGAGDTALFRVGPAQYPGDGSGSSIVSSFERANPRDISNTIAAQGPVARFNDRGLSDFVWQWGQFLDHDIDLSRAGPANGTSAIAINDPGDPLAPGPIPFERSDFDPTTGTSALNPRQQLNAVTSYIDASQVYGSDEASAASLRTFSGGKLSTGAGDLLPTDAEGFFVAGDIRVSEQVGLTAMHTLFVREHNRLAEALARQDPGTSDEELYQIARKIVGAEMQIITYDEFLPALLGPDGPRTSAFSYDPNVNAAIANEFSTALYRFGHSMLSPQLLLIDNDGVSSSSLALREAFFNPEFILTDPDNIDRVLKGLATQSAQEIDNLLVDDVRNFLFDPLGAGGLDLASLNIQRGRDHGLPDYNGLRVAYGLDPVSEFEQISSDSDVQAALRALYEDVDNIDPWVGALAEDHLLGASVGELISAALVDQFTRLRDGDRFFFLNDRDLLDPSIQAVIDLSDLHLADIIRYNTGIGLLPDNVFFRVPEAPLLWLYLLGLHVLVLSRAIARVT